jgi:universal stress protein A
MSSNYSHILLATDLLDDSDKVADKAKRLADLEQAKLSAIHVVENLPLYFGDELVLPDTEAIERQLVERSEKRMTALCDRLGIPAAQGYVQLGVTKQEITEFAEENGVDLIVVGSHSRHGLEHLLGSTARAVVNSARCDVLAVRVGRE